MPWKCPCCNYENPDREERCIECGGSIPAGNIAGRKLLENRYEILSTIKSGAMGCVYKARDTHLKNTVAVKKMISNSRSPSDMEYEQKRFLEEARMLSQLHHSGLPKVTDFFTAKDSDTVETQHFLVMTFIDGKDLETLMEERGREPFFIDEVRDYSKQILDVLDYLHSRYPPVIYRDLNPRNVMVSEGKLFLVDFGIACIFKPDQKGTAIGTPGYAAPEQYKGFAEPRSDLYSLGVIMHYLLTGSDPEDTSKGPFTFEKPEILNPLVPSDLSRLIISMIDVLPEKRPNSAKEVLERLCARAPVRAPAYDLLSRARIFLIPLIILSTVAVTIIFHKPVPIKKDGRGDVITNKTEVREAHEEMFYMPEDREKSDEGSDVFTNEPGRQEELREKEPVPEDNEKLDILYKIVTSGNKRGAEKLLAEDPELVNARPCGSPALCWAALNGQYEIAELLIRKGADVNAGNSNNATALSAAASNGS